ncbi:hypothetical protein MXB_2821 [Myxobolus squamalis]|nr:hypothetical protein MXB_2821 [Myxobolus squamalis]
MGARVKLEINKSVTHLVACDVNSSLYEDSIGLGIDVVGVDWLYHCWQQRHDALFCGTNSEISSMFRVKPFTGLSIAFYAFKGSEKKQMEEIAVSNGATIVEISSPLVSHIVIDDVVKSDFVIASRDNVWLITSQWFWKSVQFQVHYSESAYVVPHIENNKIKQTRDQQSPMRKIQSPKTPKKSPLSGIFSIGRRSKENSFQEDRIEIPTRRKLLLMELLSTEKTYVEILNTLIDVRLFKNSIENPIPKSPPFLSKDEIKKVFGAIPDILKIHTNILEDLEIINAKKNDDPNIGSIFDKHVDPMIKAYPAFINYFEIIKSTIEKHATENQCFHAFLKICQADSRCYRQSLCELLIRPVQRLPSMILILKGILKETPADSPGNQSIQRAIENITFVLNQINEDKRRTEEQLMMVEMWNNIEDCPPYVMSATRKILLKFEAFEFQEMSKYKTKHITRKRNNGIFKSSTNTINKHSPSISSLTRNKSFKHCYYIPFNMIERIIEVPDNSHSGWRNSFGLHAKNSETFEPSTIFYQIIGDQAPTLITSIFDIITKSTSCVKSIHNFVEINRADSGKSFKHPESPIISIGRALENLAAKASRRMSRAFSINGNNGLPRSISVASQITTDSISSSKFINNKTSSLQIDNISQITDFENCPAIANTSKISRKKTISKVKERTKKTLSLWRRSIQSSDVKKR